MNVVNALLHNSFLNKYLSRYNSDSFVYHEQLNGWIPYEAILLWDVQLLKTNPIRWKGGDSCD